MKSPFYFIVKPLNGKRYDNEKSIGGVDVILSSSEEDFKVSNRKAVVVSTPLGYDGPIAEGDLLLVHHNVFKFYNDMKGRRRSGRSYLFDDMFFVDVEQFFMYCKNDVWHAHSKYCFVSPTKMDEGMSLVNSSSISDFVGIMEYPNDYLTSKGINKGDLITFTPDSEYEFYLDDKKMYRIFDHQITMKL
jgi:hypothetical protein